jgi:calcium channel MID1
MDTMPFPKLSPLQSRLAASLVASIIVFVVYLTLSSSHFAYASEIDSIKPEDHNHERLLGSYILHGEVGDIEEQEVSYEAEFFGTDRGIIGRADTGPQYTELLNNAPQRMEVVPGGSTVYFFVQNSTLSGKPSGDQTGLPSPVRLLLRTENQVEEPRIPNLGSQEKIPSEEGTGNTILHSRQTGPTTLYISLNTCQQPSDPTDIGGTKGAPPQLQLYVSQSSINTLPGPDQSTDTQRQIPVVGGFANVTLQASGTVYIGVAAPSTTTFTEGNYTVEIAASIDAPFHSYIANSSNLYLIDSDMTSALLVTKNLGNSTNGTLFDEWMNLKPPFSIFAVNTNRTFIAGVQNSYCGLKTYADIAGVQGGAHSDEVQTSISNSTGSPYPKQQFLMQGLNGSSSYNGILAMTGNSTSSGAGVVGGGGRVWQSTKFQTQAGR